LEIKNFVETMGTKISTATEELEQGLEGLRSAQLAKLTSEQPVELLDSKVPVYQRRARWALGTTIAVGLFGPALLATLAEIGVEFPTGDDISSWVDYWRLGPLAVGTFLYVWALRVSLKHFTSARHMMMEAEIRSTIASSYLALLTQKGVPGSEATLLMLTESLFRPISSGLLGSESPPPTPYTKAHEFFDRIQR
jgi:hypothetical protein